MPAVETLMLDAMAASGDSTAAASIAIINKPALKVIPILVSPQSGTSAT
jgi:hypothetical protein